MKKITGTITILIFLLCAFSAQASPEIAISVPSVGEACSSDVDCASGEECLDGICIPSAGEPCSNDLDCTLGGECVNDVCLPSVGDPCSSDLDCGDGLCVNDICISSVGEPCSSDLDCEENELCIDEICVPSAGKACTNDLQCSPGELCIDDICQESECEFDEDCDEGLVCDSSAYVCVECLTTSDCQEGEFCADNNTCVQGGDCELRIRKGRINLNKQKNLPYIRQRLTIRGNENFDTSGEILVNDPLFVWDNTIRRKKNKLKFTIQVNKDPMPDEGFYPIRVGNCIGEVELYDNKAAEAAQ